MFFDLQGRTALVLGASSGIGLAISRALALEGANVIMAARRGDLVRTEAAKLESAAGLEVDLASDDSVEAMLNSAVSVFGPIDVLIVNGGGPPSGSAATLNDQLLERALHSLFLVQRRIVAATIPSMRERGWGRIVAVGSSGVQQPIEALALSNIARSALAAYLKSLASEVAQDGVTVNMVLPGRIDTERVASLDSQAADRNGQTPREVRMTSERSIPLRRYGTPEEFASVVAFLASGAASYVTGEQVRCDGGMLRNY